MKFFFDEDEIVADQIEDLLSRQQRDGVPSWHGSNPCGRRSWRPGEMKETPKICGCGCGDFFRRQVSHTSKRTRYFRNVGGLVAFAAIGLRSQKRRVRFDQDAIEWNVARDIANILRLGISGIARERNHETGVQPASRLLSVPVKQCKMPPRPVGRQTSSSELQAIGPGVAAMNDDGQLASRARAICWRKTVSCVSRGE